MKILKLLFLTFVCLASFLITGVMAQQAIPASGGNFSGSGGSVSYTIGQVVYTTNTAPGGIIKQGVQQPYEISEVGIEAVKGIKLECMVFPNPVNYLLKLKIENFKIENLWYQLYDINGKLLQNNKVEDIESNISMENLMSATYFLKVTDNNKLVKSFKIIKTK